MLANKALEKYKKVAGMDICVVEFNASVGV